MLTYISTSKWYFGLTCRNASRENGIRYWIRKCSITVCHKDRDEVTEVLMVTEHFQVILDVWELKSQSMCTNDCDTDYPMTLATGPSSCWHTVHTVKIADAKLHSRIRLTRTVLEEDGVDQRRHSWLYDGREIMIHLTCTNHSSLSSHSNRENYRHKRHM